MQGIASNSITTALLLVASCLPSVSAHGTVSGIVAGGVWYRGYNPSFQWMNPPPVVAGWSVPKDIDNGFVSDYTSTDIVCHREATPGGAYVKVVAGSTVQLQWTPWPHKSSVVTYLSPCSGDCSTYDKAKGLWTKIDESGLLDNSNAPGYWASDKLIANNNSWTVTIPASVAPGKYVLRHEIIALHVAGTVGGAQNYPQCVNIEITGAGTNRLTTGTLGTKLYTAQDPGILVFIYDKLSSYIIPGPPVMGSSGGQLSTSPVASVSTSSTLKTTVAMSTIAATGTSAAVGGAATCVSRGPVIFSGTLTGASGKPTKFSCYPDEL